MSRVFVAVMIGQSNLFGTGARHADVTNPEYSITPDDAFIWDKINLATVVSQVDDGAWTALVLGMGFDNPPGSIPDSIGSEMQLHWRLSLDKEISGPIYLVKCALGGSELAPQGASIYDWSERSTGSFSLFELFRDFYWKPAIQAIYAAGDEPFLIGVFWGQGAADAQTDDGLTYRNNLNLFYHAINDVLQVPNAPWVIQRETILSETGHPFLNEVRKAQMTAADDIPLMRIFDSDQRTDNTGRALFVQHDGEHFDGEGQVDMGDFAADELIRTIRRKTMRRIPNVL